MINSIRTNEFRSDFSGNIGKLLWYLSGAFIFIVALTIGQDFLESKRNSYAFYFSESLLFKTIWFLFIPILAVLYMKLQRVSLTSNRRTIVFIIIPVAAHLFILPFVAVIFSILFYGGRYDLYKFFSYTLANDFYVLVIVYAGFVLGYKYWTNRPGIINPESIPATNTIVINNGKTNVVVCVDDIMQITSATPYVFIHLENRKYLHSETLKSICDQLDDNVFVRVHKSAVVNITKVSSFKSRLNGDYDLQFENGDQVRLSRTYAANFKRHISAGHQVNV